MRIAWRTDLIHVSLPQLRIWDDSTKSLSRPIYLESEWILDYSFYCCESQDCFNAFHFVVKNSRREDSVRLGEFICWSNASANFNMIPIMMYKLPYLPWRSTLSHPRIVDDQFLEHVGAHLNPRKSVLDSAGSKFLDYVSIQSTNKKERVGNLASGLYLAWKTASDVHLLLYWSQMLIQTP